MNPLFQVKIFIKQKIILIMKYNKENKLNTKKNITEMK